MDDYKIIEAYFEKDAQSGQFPSETSVSVAWEVQVESDIKVFLAYNGQIVVWDSWHWDSENSKVNLKNTPTDSAFSVYILRGERAVMLAELVAKKTVTVDAILLQLQKNVRSLEQFEAVEKTSIRGLDKIGLLPNASTRKGKILSFDELGNPITETSSVEIIEAKNEAVEAAKKITSGLSVTFNDILRQSFQKIKDAIAQWSDQFAMFAKVEREKFTPFNSVAEMRASLDLRAGYCATTLGYHSANDGGGANYVIVDDASLVDDGGSVIAIGNGSLRAKLIINDNLINVRHWGAKSDYVSESSYTDTTESFKKACAYISANSSKEFTIHLPSGEYAISDTINLPSNADVAFEGVVNYIANENNRNRPALKIENFAIRKIFINKVYATGNWLDNWNASDNFAGVEIASCHSSKISIMSVVRFAVGLRLSGHSSTAWNHIYVPRLDNNRINLSISRTTGYVNANTFEGGYIGSRLMEVNGGFTGTCYSIKIDTEKGFNSNIFKNFDITGGGATASSPYKLYHVYLGYALHTILDNFRWESSRPENENNKYLVVDCKADTPMTISAGQHSSDICLTKPRFPGTHPEINIENAWYAKCSLFSVVKTDQRQTREMVRFNPSKNLLSRRLFSSGRSCLFRGIITTPNVNSYQENIDGACRLYSENINFTAFNSSKTRVYLNERNAPSFLFKLNAPESNFTITGDGYFRVYARLFDENENELIGNVRVEANVAIDGNANYGTFEGHFSALGLGKGVVTPNDTSIAPFEVYCSAGEGFVAGENAIANRIWHNSRLSTDATILGTFTSVEVVGRRATTFYGHDTLITGSNFNGKFSFSVLDESAKYVMISVISGYGSGVTLEQSPSEFAVEADDTVVYIQYPNKWAHLRGRNDFFATEKPVSVSSESFPIPAGQRVYDVALENFGKYWEYDPTLTTTSKWTDLKV